MGFMVHLHAARACDRFPPTQLGVALASGPEIFATLIRAAGRHCRSIHTDWVARSSKCDFRNTFNEVSRMAFLLFVAANFPALLPILYAAYRLPTYISALGPGGCLVRFLSRRGCTQGCPAGSLCFAAALQ